MNLNWREFLTAKGATIDEDDSRLQFNDPVTEALAVQQDDTLSPCLHWSAILIHGPDALQFLGGQLTSDLRELSDSRSQATAWCNPKGRVLANGYLVKIADSYAWVLPKQRVPVILKRLRMYVLRAKVSLEDASESLALLGCTGAGAVQQLNTCFGRDIPDSPLSATLANSCALVRLPGNFPRYLIACPYDGAPALWEQLAGPCIPVGTQAWDLTEILAGLPMLSAASSEAYLPQMLQLELHSGLSFNKGCYPGQEVITRLKFRGELKHKLYYGELDGTTLPDINTPVTLTDANGDRKIGEVVAAATLTASKIAVLAVLEINTLGSLTTAQQTQLNGKVLNFVPTQDAGISK